MDYNQAMKYIHSTDKFGSVLGLDNISYLLKLLGDPQKDLKAIHVAGTNGKGSTTAMIANVLSKQGYKVGMYTSPYIETFNERIRINSAMIADDEIASLMMEIKECIDNKIIALGKPHPTEFEIITAMAFLYFKRKECDYVVLEVGLGGRLDATNVIENPLLCVITSISFDHMQYLGNSLEEIAYEKCGIIKDNTQVVTYPMQEENVLDVINKICNDKNSDLTVANVPENIKVTLFGNSFELTGLKKIITSLAGEYQAYNAATAIAALLKLKQMGIKISMDNIYSGLAQTKWSGRFEAVKINPITVLDGGHNIAGVKELVKSIERIKNEKKTTIVMGMLADKQYKQCIELLAPIADLFVCTSVNNPRSAQPKELAEIAKQYCKDVVILHDYYDAVDFAMQNTKKSDMICITGSLYLIGDVRKYILNAD